MSDENQYLSGYASMYRHTEEVLDSWMVGINTKHIKIGTRELTDSDFELLHLFLNCIFADLSVWQPRPNVSIELKE